MCVLLRPLLSASSGVLLYHLLHVLRVVRLYLERVGAGGEPRCMRHTDGQTSSHPQEALRSAPTPQSLGVLPGAS